MRLPLEQEYQSAVQAPNVCFRDPDLRGGIAVVDKLGLPMTRAGNFAIVYQVVSDSSRWAVKCFTRDVTDLQRRYENIDQCLGTTHLPYFVTFRYLSDGILINGDWYPVVKMEWVDGIPLNEYVRRNLGDRAKLLDLNREWVRLMADLHRCRIAHGDLQFGNILIAPDGQIKLVDYDSMFVPALAGSPSRELGHRNFQHPKRTESDFGPDVDNFSAWVIGLSLLACATHPEFWDSFNGGEDCLLMRQHDFDAPILSPLLTALETSFDFRLATLTQEFVHFLDLPASQTPPLSGVFDESEAARVTISRPWYFDDTAPEPALIASDDTESDVSWWRDESNTTSPVVLGFSCWPDRCCAAAAAGVLLLMVWYGVVGLIGPEVFLLAESALFVTIHRIALLRYRCFPEVKEKRDLAVRVAEVRICVEETRKASIATRKAQASYEQSILRDDLELQRQLDAAKRRNRDETARIAGELTQHLNEINRQRQANAQAKASKLQALANGLIQSINKIEALRINSRTDEQAELATRLERLQENYIQVQLRLDPIGSMEVSGVGQTLKSSLRAGGIATAADISYSAVSRIYGIGPDRASRIVKWRDALHRTYLRSAPRDLPADIRDRIEAKFETVRRQLDVDDAAVRQQAKANRAQIDAQFVAKEAALQQLEQDARVKEATARRQRASEDRSAQIALEGRRAALCDKAKQERDRLSRELGAATDLERMQNRDLAKLEVGAKRYERVTFYAYLQVVFPGLVVQN